VQVAPINPTLKAPKPKRLKLKYDETLSIVAFKSNLRRYNMADLPLAVLLGSLIGALMAFSTAAGAYTRSLFGST
jgi:hypothetical protein